MNAKLWGILEGLKLISIKEHMKLNIQTDCRKTYDAIMKDSLKGGVGKTLTRNI